MSETVRAARVTNLRGPSSIQVLEADVPERRQGESLVEVRAVAPAFPDLLKSERKYQVQPDLPFSPGSDFAGVVLEPAEGSEFARGDRVAGCLSYGAAAEILSVPEDRIYPLPPSLSYVEGAALPMNYLTSHFALFTRGGLRPDNWVMVLGASRGVGLASIQDAAGLGARVIAAVSTEERAAVALEAGAHHAVLRADVPQGVRELTGGHGVDIVVDVVGGDLTDALRSLAPFGRLMAVGFASGGFPAVKVNRLLFTNADVRGARIGLLVATASAPRRGTSSWPSPSPATYPLVRHGGSLAEYGKALAELAARGRRPDRPHGVTRP